MSASDRPPNPLTSPPSSPPPDPGPQASEVAAETPADSSRGSGEAIESPADRGPRAPTPDPAHAAESTEPEATTKSAEPSSVRDPHARAPSPVAAVEEAASPALGPEPVVTRARSPHYAPTFSDSEGSSVAPAPDPTLAAGSTTAEPGGSKKATEPAPDPTTAVEEADTEHHGDPIVRSTGSQTIEAAPPAAKGKGKISWAGAKGHDEAAAPPPILKPAMKEPREPAPRPPRPFGVVTTSQRAPAAGLSVSLIAAHVTTPVAATVPATALFNRVKAPFLSALGNETPANSFDDPNYYAVCPEELISTCTPHVFRTGTGSTLYDSLSDYLQLVEQELIIVTCFWEPSRTLSKLSEILRNLARRPAMAGRLARPEGEKLRVRICFSSRSPFQKLFHKQSALGQEYPPKVWLKKLGLSIPAADLNRLDLKVKSVFLLPFSVMHPKFMIIDQKRVVLPSCNISGEEWFECFVTLSGGIVHQFLHFYKSFWARSYAPAKAVDQKRTRLDPETTSIKPREATEKEITHSTKDYGHGHFTLDVQHHEPTIVPVGEPMAPLRHGRDRDRPSEAVQSIFLPSPHHRLPHFQPFTSLANVKYPPTPLNILTLTLFDEARQSIEIFTPNLTSPPVLAALLRAMERGVNVTIRTNKDLMVREQIVTAGTTTTRCLKKLKKRYMKMRARVDSTLSDDRTPLVAGTPGGHPGSLSIYTFRPMHGPRGPGEDAGCPQRSHMKLTVVDRAVVLLGSGNMDRASWFTSQELGVALFDENLAERVLETVRLASGEVDIRTPFFESTA